MKHGTKHSLKALDSYMRNMAFTAEVSIGVNKNPAEALSIALSKLTTPIEIPKNLDRVVIKPSIYDPNLVGNTHVEVVRAVINSFRNLGPIAIIESDNPVRSAAEAFGRTGYTELSTPTTLLVGLSSAPVSIVKMPGHFFTEHNMPMILSKPNFFINVPTAKLQPEICSVAAGIKNLFGLIPEVGKNIYHMHIHDVLLDILSVFRPHLTIVDLTSLVIGRRSIGITKNIRAIIVGTDPVAVDAFCSDLLGVDPLKVSYLKRAYDLGLGEILLDRIRIRGTEPQKEILFRLCRH
jgi:uncharacterized protein (DUF362 family)